MRTCDKRRETDITWPMLAACSGNCNQGRMCDCVADVENDAAAGSGVFVWPAVVALALFAALAVVHFWSAT